MKQRRKIPFIILAFFLCHIVLLSCTDDDWGNEKDKGTFIWDININSSEVTRGQPINSTTDTLFDSFGIYSYISNGNFAVEPLNVYMDNEKVLKKTENNWELTTHKLWPNKGALSFFAYYPYIDGTHQNGLSIRATDNQVPVITYRMPKNAKDQPDLMIATCIKNIYNEVVSLNFNHALTCIGFNIVGESINNIEYITISGISTSAQTSLTCDGNITWDNYSGSNDTIFYAGLNTDTGIGSADSPLMEPDGYLMVLPQSLDLTPTFTIKFKNSEPKTANLKTNNITSWEPGKLYMYTLNETGNIFNVTVDNNECTFLGGKFTFAISSTYDSSPIGWTANITDYETGTPIISFDSSNLDDNNGGMNIMKTINAEPSIGSSSNIEDDLLKSAAPVNNLNLAYNPTTGWYSTANCYIVNAPGSYKFPCNIMGNGVKNGYDTTFLDLTNWNCWFGFGLKDYKGDYIDEPLDLLIETSGARAELVWEDAPQLISNLKIDDDYIYFTITQEAIMQGNAIIAIVNAQNQIMWSWHIWVTPYVLNQNDVVLNNTTFMAKNIGSCTKEAVDFPQRMAKITFTQDITGDTLSVILTQEPSYVNSNENSLYYQWGRKDPMPGTNGNIKSGTSAEYEQKSTFGNKPFEISNAGSGVTVGTGIQNPNTFYSSTDAGTNYLWCSDISSNTTFWSEWAKTIYDPSPIGYKVPASHKLDGLTYTNAGQAVNVIWHLNGILASQQGNPAISTFINAVGQQNNEGTIVNYSKLGYYWSAVATTNNNSFILSFMQHGSSPTQADVFGGNGQSLAGVYTNQLLPQYYNYYYRPTSFGNSIRPVKETEH